MADQIENTELGERERVLRDFGKDFSEGRKPGESAERPEKVDSKPEQAPETATDVQADTRARDEKGKFAPKPEPFEGFSKLDPKIQEQINALQKERDRYKGDYAAVAGRLPGVQREVETLRARLQQPQTTEQKTQTQVDINDLLKSEKWKLYESRYPEDAEGVRSGFQEMMNNLVSRFSDSANPLNEKVQQIESRLGELDARELKAKGREIMTQLSEKHPEWMKIAGWEDDDGNLIPDDGRRKWHPWFQAWKDSLPTLMQRNYDQMTSSMDVQAIDYVLSHFKRDVEAAQSQQGTDELSQRRAEALRDTSPRPSRSGSEPSNNPFENRNDADADRKAILDRYLKTYQAGQRI